jgi:hypothetical protein
MNSLSDQFIRLDLWASGLQLLSPQMIAARWNIYHKIVIFVIFNLFFGKFSLILLFSISSLESFLADGPIIKTRPGYQWIWQK